MSDPSEEVKAVKLSPSQHELLAEIAKNGSATVFRSHTATLLALERKGLVTWTRNGGQKYGYGPDTARAVITDAGRASIKAKGE